MSLSKKIGPISNKENINPGIKQPVSDEAQLRDLKMQRMKLNGSKIPGQFTKKKLIVPDISTLNEEYQLQDIINANLVYQESLKKWISELEQMMGSLIAKNDKLLEENRKMTEENACLKQNLEEMSYENQLLRSRSASGIYPSIFSYFSKTVQLEIILEPQPFEIEGLPEGNYMKCRIDNNVNIRAFYLSMLQYPESRNCLRELLQELKIDDSYKILPLMQTNEFWVEIGENFLDILDNNQLNDLQDIYQYINKCSLLDLIFISSLRSRAAFLTDEQYDNPTQTMQFYTVMANNCSLKQERIQTANYEIYRFSGENYSFDVVLTDRNEFIVRFIDIHTSEQAQSQYSLEVQSNKYIEKQPNSSVSDEVDMRFTPGSSVQQDLSGIRHLTAQMLGHRKSSIGEPSAVKGFEPDDSPMLN